MKISPALSLSLVAGSLLLGGCTEAQIAPLKGAQYRREQFVANQPTLNEKSRAAVLSGVVYVGMSAAAAEASWGPPTRINRTETRYSSREQWVYEGFTGNYIHVKNRYLYIEAGEVVAIQD